MSQTNFEKLIFIPDSLAYNHYQQHYPELIQNRYAYLTFDINVAALLPEQTTYYYLQDLATSDHQFQKTSLDLSTMMEDMYPDITTLEHRGVNIWKPLNKTVLFPYRAIIVAVKALEKLSQEIQWDQLVLSGSLSHPVYIDTGEDFESDGVQAGMGYWAIKNKRSVHWLRPTQEVSEANAYIRYVVAETNLGIASPEPVNTMELSRLFEQHKGKKCLLLIGNSSDTHDITLWTQKIKASSEYFLIHLSTRQFFCYEAGPSHLFLDFRYFYGWPHFDYEEYLKLEAHIEQALDNPNPNYAEQYDYIFQNDFLAFQKDWLKKCLLESYRVIESTYWIQQAFSVQLVIYGYGYMSKTVAAAVNALKQWQVPALNVLHGGFWGKHHFKSVAYSEYAFARGEKFKEGVEEFFSGQKSPQVYVVGDLRQQSQALKKKQETQKKNRKPTILFLSSKIVLGLDTGEKDHFSLKEHEKSLVELISLTQRREDLAFLWKPHPRHDYFNYYERFLQNHIHFCDRNSQLVDIFEQVDICVLVNNISSIMVEAAVASVPTLQLRTAFRDDSGIYVDFIDLDYVANNTDELEQKIDRLVSDHAYKLANIHSIRDAELKWSQEVGEQAVINAMNALDEISAHFPRAEVDKNEGLHWVSEVITVMGLRAEYHQHQNMNLYRQKRTAFINSQPDPLRAKILETYLKETETWV